MIRDDLKHDMDEMTKFCRRCGASARQIEDRDLPCTNAPNVVAISHITSRGWFERADRPS